MTIVTRYRDLFFSKVQTLAENDGMLFEVPTLSKNHVSPRKLMQSPATRRQSDGHKRGIPTLHANQQKPLPSLAEDDDTLYLRQHISSLEATIVDQNYQIEDLDKKISELQAQLSGRSPAGSSARGSASELETYYHQKYDETKKKYDGLRKALKEKGKITRISANSLRPIQKP